MALSCTIFDMISKILRPWNSGQGLLKVKVIETGTIR